MCNIFYVLITARMWIWAAFLADIVSSLDIRRVGANHQPDTPFLCIIIMNRGNYLVSVTRVMFYKCSTCVVLGLQGRSLILRHVIATWWLGGNAITAKITQLISCQVWFCRQVLWLFLSSFWSASETKVRRSYVHNHQLSDTKRLTRKC